MTASPEGPSVDLPNRYVAQPAWSAVDAYFQSHLVPEDAALVEARTSGALSSLPNAEVAANQGAFLGLLARLMGARRILEFGTLTGYSTIWLARAAGPEGAVVTLELDPGNAELARQNFERAGLEVQISVMVGPASDSAQQLIDASITPFDLIFIDADKPNNPQYLEAALQLSRPGSLIIIDNVVRDGHVIEAATDDPRVQGVRDVVELIAQHPALEATALQTVGEKGWDGLLIALRVDPLE